MPKNQNPYIPTWHRPESIQRQEDMLKLRIRIEGKLNRKCSNCKNYEPFSGVCCNADSEWVADFKNEDDSCPQWIKIKETEG